MPVAAAILLGAGVSVLVVQAMREADAGPSEGVWRDHHAASHEIPGEAYHLDRFRALRGGVTDTEGRPVGGAFVRSVRIEDLVGLAENGPPASPCWVLPIEAETRSDARGRYEFPHLDVGGRTLFYDPPAGDLAPAVKELIVIQDGLGAQLDVAFERAQKLRVIVTPASEGLARLMLIPTRWWLTAPEAVRDAEGVWEFQGLGGPLRRGLIATGSGDGEPLRIVGRYDLDASCEITIAGDAPSACRRDLPEAAGLQPWAAWPSAEERRFFAAVSPIPLFWKTAQERTNLWPGLEALGAMAGTLDRLVPQSAAARGFAPHPFLPVLVESRWAAPRLAWTSEASEFTFDAIPPSAWRARSYDLFGKLTFAGGFVSTSHTETGPIRLRETIDLDEPDSRQVVGFVRWENGQPADRAPVFMQDATNFRNYVRRVETDDQGFFRFTQVPGDAPYFVFAVPGDDTAIRSSRMFALPAGLREAWCDLTLHAHRIVGVVPPRQDSPRTQRDGVAGSLLQLLRIDESGPGSVAWEFRPETSGRFALAEVAQLVADFTQKRRPSGSISLFLWLIRLKRTCSCVSRGSST
jgi:hypothetical protein